MDGVEYVPAPSLYPHNITGLNPGKTYTFHVQAEQFGEAIQSPVVTIKGISYSADNLHLFRQRKFSTCSANQGLLTVGSGFTIENFLILKFIGYASSCS